MILVWTGFVKGRIKLGVCFGCTGKVNKWLGVSFQWKLMVGYGYLGGSLTDYNAASCPI